MNTNQSDKDWMTALKEFLVLLEKGDDYEIARIFHYCGAMRSLVSIKGAYCLHEDQNHTPAKLRRYIFRETVNHFIKDHTHPDEAELIFCAMEEQYKEDPEIEKTINDIKKGMKVIREAGDIKREVNLATLRMRKKDEKD